MTTIAASAGYPDEAHYWKMVELTLRYVFGFNGEDSALLAMQLVRRLADASPAERLIGFHTEPLQVAADLSMTKIIEPHYIKNYLDLASKHGWHAESSAQTERSRLASV